MCFRYPAKIPLPSPSLELPPDFVLRGLQGFFEGFCS